HHGPGVHPPDARGRALPRTGDPRPGRAGRPRHARRPHRRAGRPQLRGGHAAAAARAGSAARAGRRSRRRPGGDPAACAHRSGPRRRRRAAAAAPGTAGRGRHGRTGGAEPRGRVRRRHAQGAGVSLRRLWALVLKEVRQLRRDRMTLGMILGIPMLQLVLFGYAINLNLRGLDAAVADQANTAGSRALVMDMLATGVVTPVAEAKTPAELMALLRGGRISVGIVIPPDFERRRIEGRELAQVLGDRRDTVVQDAAVQRAQVPVAPVPSRPAGGGETRSGPDHGRVVALYNPERRSEVNIVPGLIGVILTMTMVMFAAVAIVRERERGNIELLIATPISRTELMVGKVLPYIGIGLLQVTVVLLLGLWLFRVPIRGSVLDVYLASGLLILASLTLGLLISTRARTQFQSTQLTMFVFLPSLLLSG